MGPTGRGPGSRAGPPTSSGAQLDSRIRARGQSPTPPGPLLPAISPAPGRRPKETPPTRPRHPVDKNSRAEALGSVMGATCWPDVPGRDRQECSGPGAPGRPRPRTDQAGAASGYTAVYFLAFLKVVCKDVGGRSLTCSQVPPRSLPGPPSVRLRLRVDGAQGPGLPSPLLHLHLVGRGRQDRPSGEGQPPAPYDPHPPTSSSRRFSFSLFSSSQMSVSFLLRTGGRGGGVGWAGLEPRAPLPAPAPSSSPLTPAAPPSAPATSLKIPSRPVASLYRLCHFCCP